MTERGPRTGIGGAPNPARPSHSGDAPAPAGRPPAAVPAMDLAAVRRTDALIETLAARCAVRPEGGTGHQADDPDPAARLLRALITDVDDQDPGLDGDPPAPSGPGSRRRGSRTIVALGVAGVVLASTGVAAAGGGAARTSAAPVPSVSGVSEETAEPVRDLDAETRIRPQVPARPAPAPPAARGPSGDPEREDMARLKRRLEYLFPPRPRAGRPDVPTLITRSAPAARPNPPADDGPLRRLDDLRREAGKQANRHGTPRWNG